MEIVKRIKVVIDTNILISGSYDESSYAFKIVKEVIDGRLEAFASHQTMSENRQMLRKTVKDKKYREFLEDFFRRLAIVKVYKRLNAVSDSEDNKLFESAVAAGADYLVTGDREVLDVGEYRNTKVVRPDEFWSIYENKKGGDSAWRDWTKMVMGG